jgi:VWFA-related protein
MALMARTLELAPSRHVILAITNGKDHGSAVLPKDLIQRARNGAVAIFALDPTYRPGRDAYSSGLYETELGAIAASSGGLRLGVEPGRLEETVRSVVTMVRGRYIAQLRVPSDAKPGDVEIAARVAAIPSETYIIRITGNWVPLLNLPDAGGSSSEIARDDGAPNAEPIRPATGTVSEPAVSRAVLVPQSEPAQEQGVSPAQEVSHEPVSEAAGRQTPTSRNATPKIPSPIPDSSTATLKVNTRLTLVDVTVTNAKGRPVHGLTKTDFTVKEDGKDQPIKNFEELGGGPSAQAGSRLPAGVFTNAQTAGPTMPAVDILLFDQVSTGISYGLQPNPQMLKDAKEAASKFLTTVPVGTQIAILKVDGGGLHVVQGFTSDQKLQLAAVNSIRYGLVPESYWDPAPQTWLLLCNAMNFQSAQALNALNQTAVFVSNLPGRKNLIWFSPGIPWLTNYQVFNSFSLSQILTSLKDYTTQLQAVYGRLTAARVALYPIDARGVLIGGTGTVIPGFSQSAFLDNGSLDDMAKATGGEAHYSNNDLADALQKDSANGADYYALSYVPPLSNYDGKYHKIEVKVDQPGVELEYRRGYTSLDPERPLLDTRKDNSRNAQLKDPFHATLAFGAPAATQMTFAVRALPSTGPHKAEVVGSPNPELKGKLLVRYGFDFDVPRNKITLVTQPDGSRKGSFELAIVAYDVQGKVLNSLDEKRSFVLKPDAVTRFLQKPLVVPMELDLPPGTVSVRAGVLDLPSEDMGVVEIPLTVTAP